MANAYRPTYIRPIPKGAKRCKLKGKPAVRYSDRRGKVHVRLIHFDKDGNETGKMVCVQRRWWMRWALPDGTQRRKKGYLDRTATEHEAARLEREAARMASGFIEVEEGHLSAPISEHVEAYLEDLERMGRAAKYRYNVEKRLDKMIDLCGWQTLQTIRSASLTPFLAHLKTKGAAAKTLNEYINTAKAFLNWCITQGRLAANPLANVSLTDQTEKKRKRRALTAVQAQRLVSVAGPRRLVYTVAMTTGLRRSELADLRWGDLRIEPSELRPYVALRAEATKARRADTIPLREDVARKLRDARPKGFDLQGKVFECVPNMDTFKADLQAAEIPFLDEAGRRADFHALRMTFGTMLAKSGVAPRTAMELMRHTDLHLTMGVYTDPTILDTAGAVEQLPDLNGTEAGVSGLRTGTYDAPMDSSREGGRKVLPKSTVRPGGSRHVQARRKAPDGPKSGNAPRYLAPRVGLEPTT